MVNRKLGVCKRYGELRRRPTRWLSLAITLKVARKLLPCTESGLEGVNVQCQLVHSENVLNSFCICLGIILLMHLGEDGCQCITFQVMLVRRLSAAIIILDFTRVLLREFPKI